MAHNRYFSEACVNALAGAFAASLNSGKLRLYDGVQPANSDTAITTQVLLAELTFGATAFGSASGGVITANAITAGTANTGGPLTWFRAFKSDGTTAITDGTAGRSGADANIPTVDPTTGLLTPGSTVTCAAFVYTQPKS
jgi:hypothetical protein